MSKPSNQLSPGLQIARAVRRAKLPSAAHVAVLLTLAWHLDATWVWTVSQIRLASETSQSRRSVQRVLEWLRAHGWVSWTAPSKLSRDPIKYTLSVPERRHTDADEETNGATQAPSRRHTDADNGATQTHSGYRKGSDGSPQPKGDPRFFKKETETVLATYREAFQGARRTVPPETPRDTKDAERLVTACGGVDEACDVIRKAFADDYWKGKATLRTIAADPARFMGTASPKAGKVTPQRGPAPGEYDWQNPDAYDGGAS